jgi:hypothetical protein
LIVDAVGSVAFHPFKAEVLSVSGTRHFDVPEESSSDSDDDVCEQGQPAEPLGVLESSTSHILDTNLTSKKAFPRRQGHTVLDSSMKLWSFDSSGIYNPQAKNRNMET